MIKTPSSQVDLIREAFHYKSRFDGATMVFKIDFPLTEGLAFSYLMKDLALLAQTGFRVVIVPGAKERIDEILQEYGIISSYRGTTRITARSALPFVEMAAFDVATRFITGLSGNRVDAVIGNFVRARGLGVLEGLDMESTGTVDRIFTESINQILNLKMVPILPCIGWSPAGKPYNLLSDEIALWASKALEAAKLFIISANEGLTVETYSIPKHIPIGETGHIIKLTPQEAETILETNQGSRSSDRPLQELLLALHASKAGVERVQIIDGREEGAVLRELFSNHGVGTMIYADEYEAIQPLKSADIPGILRLMEPLVQQGNLVRRTAEQIQGKKEDYVVFMIDGSIHACGALHDWGEGQGEIAAVATDPDYTDMGLGRRIVHYLISRGVKQGLHRVFVLTTRTQDWFESLGFGECSVESLPERRRNQYDHNRRSKIFALELAHFQEE
jgi:amino-acid N-acetyltransferase